MAHRGEGGHFDRAHVSASSVRPALGISAAGYVIFKLHPPEKNGALLTVQILASLTALLYFVAVAKCEPNPAVTGDDTGTGKGETSGAGAPKAAAPAASPAGFFGGLFSREKQEAAIAQGVAAGALTAGQALFAAESQDPAPVQGATAPKASLFTGGSLFPGSGTSKCECFEEGEGGQALQIPASHVNSSTDAGFGDDKPEANPFLSS